MLTHVDIAFLERMQREYDSLTQRWREAAPYSQEVANLAATFKARDSELGNAVAGGLFGRMLTHVRGVPGRVRPEACTADCRWPECTCGVSPSDGEQR